jgi:mRNA-degrading endonuclease HigB of HigAB toxin-antitoxin module
MRPDDRELDDEIRGHLALEIQQRIDRGESPQQARANALRQFGYVPQMRDEMRRVWYGRWYDMAEALVQDMRVGLRSLMRAKGLAATVVITLALGIGANAAIFSVVRGVLLRPLVNRGEDRLIYVRQSAPGLGTANMTFSVPEIEDFKSRVTTVGSFGDFSTIDFTMLGFGEPRVVQAGVVSGSYFEVMGLRPVLGRLLNAADDLPDAAEPLQNWYHLVREAEWENLQDTRRVYPHADAVTVGSGGTVTVFNIGGKKYRLIVAIHFDRQRFYVLCFLPHAEYSKNRWKDSL